MAVTAAALRQLHRIHQHLAELRDQLERGPRQIRARESNVSRLQTSLDEVHERVKQTQMVVDRKQLDLRAGEQKIVDAKTKLNACSSNKEYQALLEQIAAAEMANSVLSDEILEGLEKLDTLGAEVKTEEQALATGRQELEKARSAVQAATAKDQVEVARLEGELTRAESALPSDFRIDYDRVIRQKGADGLAVVDDGVCTGCGQNITLNMQNDLQLSRAAFCKSCGRLLYLPEA